MQIIFRKEPHLEEVRKKINNKVSGSIKINNFVFNKFN